MKLNRKWRRRLSGLTLACGIALPLGWFALPFAVNIPPGLLENPAASPVILDRHGAPILHLTLADSSRATPIRLEEVPQDLIDCTLAAEDKRFYQHGGVDLLATLRAAKDFFAHRRVVSGASTITQQLIKISSPAAKRNPFTKIYESLAARRLEMTWTKDQILTAYLNRLDYGNLRIGTDEAARFYFQKPLKDLSLSESALLAGLPQAPSRLNPLRHPKRATIRRNTVLKRLEANRTHSSDRIKPALSEPLSLRPLRETNAAPWLINQALQAPGPDGRVITTLDLKLQRALEVIVREETAKLKDSNLRHAAIVAIHNPTGEVLALVSSANWSDPRGGQLNGALTPRSPGSTLKPFTYILAMEKHQRLPFSILADIPTRFRTPQGLDLPENYDRTYRGPVTLRTALACSLNVPALRELNDLGGPLPLFKFLHELGITTLGKDPAIHGLGLTLGNAPVRLFELTQAYSTLARQGMELPPRIFPGPREEVLRKFSSQSAWLIADILSDSSARAPAFQPGGPLDLPFRCAVKTGTSSDFHDNWCIGFTPEFTIGVWAGNFEHQPMKGLSGIAGAAPMFHRAMVKICEGTTQEWYPKPEGVEEIRIDPRNGKLVPADAKISRPDYSTAATTPLSANRGDYDAEGRALLSPEYAEWFSSSHNSRRSELAMDSSARNAEPLRIISPADESTYLLDPEIPSGSDKLRPITNLPGTARWYSETLRIEPGTPEPIIHLSPGTHIITATDPATGIVHTLTLRVKSL